MQKTILITGATDGLGLETAKMLASLDHNILLHGRNLKKLEDTVKTVSDLNNKGTVKSYVADLSRLTEVITLARAIKEQHNKIDILINNAGVFKTTKPTTEEGLDVRFVVNTIAPYLLTQTLLPLLDESSRVINLSSAAQASVDLDALTGKKHLNDMEAYSQSKLAIIMWSNSMATELKENGPMIISVNPGSLLATKMVKEGFGMEGKDILIGAEILTKIALKNEFKSTHGQYFDNDQGMLGSPHKDALDSQKSTAVVNKIESILAKHTI